MKQLRFEGGKREKMRVLSRRAGFRTPVFIARQCLLAFFAMGPRNALLQQSTNPPTLMCCSARVIVNILGLWAVFRGRQQELHIASLKVFLMEARIIFTMNVSSPTKKLKK